MHAPPVEQQIAPQKAQQRYTTRAKRALAPLLTLNERGALDALIDAGISYETGYGIVSYEMWAKAAGLSRRQAIRYGQRLHARGIVEKQPRFWSTARPDGDFNRANGWQLRIPIIQPNDPDLQAFLQATQDLDEAENNDPPAAQEAAAGTPPPALADTFEERPQAAARVAAAASLAAADAGRAADSDEAQLLARLREYEELARIATAADAAKIWRVARRHGKSLAQTLLAIGDAADKASERLTEPQLVSHVIACVRAERRPGAPTPPPAPKLAPAETLRISAERALKEEAERVRKRRAAEALAAGITSRSTGPPKTTD